MTASVAELTQFAGKALERLAKAQDAARATSAQIRGQAPPKPPEQPASQRPS